MKIIRINKHSSKLKDWKVEMPNAPYVRSMGVSLGAKSLLHFDFYRERKKIFDC